MMDICILGGTGFLGSHLAARLAAEGHRLRIPTRSIAANQHLQVLPTVRLIQADIHDPEMLARLLAGCDVAVNLVGILNESGRSKSFQATHTELTARLVAACQAQHVSKLVQVSALGADAKTAPSLYLRTKGQAEQIIIEQTDGPAWTILQPSVIFGPGDSFINRFANLLRLIPFMFPLAMPNTRFAPVHVDDVTTATCKVITDPKTNGKTYQLCGTEIFSLAELVRIIARTIGVRRWIPGLPDWLSATQGAIMGLVPGKPFSLDNFRSLKRHSVCSTNGMEQLGIIPRSFEMSMRECIDSLNAHSALDTYRKNAGR